jgi:hypothetical protein
VKLPGAAWIVLLLSGGSVAAGPPDFDKSIAPILVKNCITCHNSAEPRGGLDLTHQEAVLKGGKSGPALIAGKPQDSYLIERVAAGSMPPKKKASRLSANEVAALRTWVQDGAQWPAGRVLSPFAFTTDRRAGLDWWSLQPLSWPTVPTAAPEDNDGNPIDTFVRAQLRRHGLTFAPPADRITYLRRVKYDLLGLPPTPEEIDGFVADLAPDAYERLIERLLASPQYGERWGRHWLDVVRFGESDGFENDKLREHAWPYRDYVIRSFNADKPYPQFIKEQLAGDVLTPVTRDGIAATGFLVAGPWDEVQNVGKSKLERMRTHEEQLEELIGTVAQSFLGMTVNCARCHDHKFDPVPQSDYYRLKAVFDGVDHGNGPLWTPDEQATHDRMMAPLQARVRELKAALEPLKYVVVGAAVLEKPDPQAVVAGRFGHALNARKTHAAARARPAYQKSPLTVECWAKVASKTNFNILVANNVKESADHWEIYTYSGSGAFSAYLPGYAPAEIVSGVDITDDRWHYLAMTCDGKRVRLSVDGRLVRDAAVIRQGKPGPEGMLYFGAYPAQGLGCDGILDEVRISNGIRPIDRVPASPFATDVQTIGLWHFDALAGDRFPDWSQLAEPAGRDVHKPRRDELVAELKRREDELSSRAPPLVYAGVRRQPDPTLLLLRGDIRQPGPRVTPGGLSAIRSPSPELGLSADAPEGQRRLRFAEWIAQPAHPLTARVMVNRIWQYHFGQALVDTPSDFGFNAGRPSHPELLDWLAQQFIASGGSVKHLHRLILLSAAYRQAARFDPGAAALDADNRLLWQFAPRRLEAETVRDAMLAVSGELNPRMGGPSFRPFTVTVFLTHFYHLIDPGTPEFNRRTVYRINVNTAKSPLLDALDCPAPSLTMPRRRTTTTTLQALALMNDSFVLRQADRFADRVRRSTGRGVEAQVGLAFRLALGRVPKPDELAAAVRVVREQGLASACWALLNSSEFLYLR